MSASGAGEAAAEALISSAARAMYTGSSPTYEQTVHTLCKAARQVLLRGMRLMRDDEGEISEASAAAVVRVALHFLREPGAVQRSAAETIDEFIDTHAKRAENVGELPNSIVSSDSEPKNGKTDGMSDLNIEDCALAGLARCFVDYNLPPLWKSQTAYAMGRVGREVSVVLGIEMAAVLADQSMGPGANTAMHPTRLDELLEGLEEGSLLLDDKEARESDKDAPILVEPGCLKLLSKHSAAGSSTLTGLQEVGTGCGALDADRADKKKKAQAQLLCEFARQAREAECRGSSSVVKTASVARTTAT